MCAVLAAECEDFLVAQASKTRSFLQRSHADALVEWLEWADKCHLEKLISFCIAEFACRGKVPPPLPDQHRQIIPLRG